MNMHNANIKNIKKRAWNRVRAFLMVSGLVLPAGIISPAQSADLDCAARDRLAKQLQVEFSELPTGVGVTSAGTLIELWKADGGETWTLMVSLPDGTSCIVGSGNNWMPMTSKGASAVALGIAKLVPETRVDVNSRP
jgi:hypothetical protein